MLSYIARLGVSLSDLVLKLLDFYVPLLNAVIEDRFTLAAVHASLAQIVVCSLLYLELCLKVFRVRCQTCESCASYVRHVVLELLGADLSVYMSAHSRRSAFLSGPYCDRSSHESRWLGPVHWLNASRSPK